MALLPNMLQALARQEIITIWDVFIDFGPSRTNVWNQLRKLFNLSTQREAVDLAKYASDYAQTEIGQEQVQCGYYDNCDVISKSDTVSPVFHDDANYRVHIYVTVGDRHCSRWVDFLNYPDHGQLANAAMEIARECASQSPQFMKVFEDAGGSFSYFEILDIKRIKA